MEKNKNGIKYYLWIIIVAAIAVVAGIVALVSKSRDKEKTDTNPTVNVTESAPETSGEGVTEPDTDEGSKETEDGEPDADDETTTLDSVIPQEQTIMPPAETKTEPPTETEAETERLPERETITLPPVEETQTVDDPTEEDTQEQTEPSTQKPTQKPTEPPTQKPTEPPTQKPTEKPTEPPTQKPTEPPTEKPTEPPTQAPTEPPVKSDEQKFKEAGGQYRVNDDGTVTVTGGTNVSGALVIPAVIDGRKVKDIEVKAFRTREPSRITSVEIHAETIGMAAFHGCSSLTSVVIGSEVKVIDEYAFHDCIKLTSVRFDTNKVTYLPAKVFGNCRKLASLTLPASITKLDREFMYVSARGLGAPITDVVPMTLYVEAKRGVIWVEDDYVQDPYDLEKCFERKRAYPDSKVTVVYVNG